MMASDKIENEVKTFVRIYNMKTMWFMFLLKKAAFLMFEFQNYLKFIMRNYLLNHGSALKMLAQSRFFLSPSTLFFKFHHVVLLRGQETDKILPLIVEFLRLRQ